MNETAEPRQLDQERVLALVGAARRRSRWNRIWILLVLADLAGLGVALALAHVARVWAGGDFSQQQILVLWPLPLLMVVFIANRGGYARTPPHPAEELRRLFSVVTLAFILFITATFFFRNGTDYSRVALVLSWLLTLGLVPLARVLLRAWGARREWWGEPVVVIGAGLTATIVIRQLLRWPSRGLRPILVLDDDRDKQGSEILGIPVVGPIEPAALLAASAGISSALFAMPGAPVDRVRHYWRLLGPKFHNVLIVPGMGEFASLWFEVKDLGGQPALELRQSLLRPSRRALKRALDLVLVASGLVVAAPLLLLLALTIRCTSAGPVFYGQRRIGRGREFRVWKFRTMRQDADVVLASLLASDPALRAEWERDHKLRRDPRVTWIGNFLRKTSLDELPQLWNVLIGEMSLVGPRPVTTEEIPKYGDQWELYQRVLPGLTGLWQVSGRNQTTYDERVALDAFYVHNWSPWLDLVILARTVQTVLRSEGAY
jgi:Undecaprenyl-phosphate galactose phosphotransferase WbaP